MSTQTSDSRLSPDQSGLNSQQARDRLAEHGPNEPAASKRRSVVGQILALFGNPLVLILLIASLATALLGEVVNASIIVGIVLLSIIVDFAQTYRSQRSAERLRDQVAPTATVLRDGVWGEQPRREIVPGDVIRLAAGDLVPADATLVQSRDLHVNEAALTGESLPAEKQAGDAAGTATADSASKVFLGTSVVSGTGTAVVTATGKATAFGDIAARLATRPPETEFERGTRSFGLLIMQTVFFMVVFVFLVSAALKRDPLQTLLFAVALAVGLTPEFLPMITTVTLGEGAVHMSRRKVVVKNLASIQNLGSMDILCSDKTGTLTSGDMTLDRHVDSFGKSSQRVFLYAYLNSLHETGIQDAADAAILRHANINPLDNAILMHEHPDVKAFSKVDEIPFDFERRRISIVVEKEGERILITKGAPESILPLCVDAEADGAVRPVDADTRARCTATYQELGGQGYRVLAVGTRRVPMQKEYHVADEKELALLGYTAFIDPPLPDAADALQDLARDGVGIKILTGDNELVARRVCEQVGLDASETLVGDALGHMSDTALAHVAETTTLFARVSPAQKNRIILALKSRGHVVGYMGDGINDAPSLHTADVGISVATAVDVAKDAADIILMERGLRVLHSGITEGRKAFGNVIKYLLMGTSSNFGNMFSMAGASLVLPFLPMLPTQILLNNFLYDLSQITIPTDNVDDTFVRKPRKWNISFIRDFMLVIGPLSSLYDFLTFYVLLNVFHASESLFHTGWFVESLATQTLVIFAIRTFGNPLLSRPAKPLTITTLVIVLVGMALPFSPAAGVLGFAPLPAGYFVFLALATATYLLLVQWVKGRMMSRLML
ncbi:MAG: magnesium-translocating P-type ATPase [Chloroflexi bacterium]|nr:magnesium-translocating P-type ATPase [Chloroflexota bacterium]